MITFFQVNKAYSNGQIALQDVNLNIERGEFVVVRGASGSGKSSLLKCMYMELLPDRGEVVVEGFRSSSVSRRDIAQLRRQLGVVFQDFKLLNDRSIQENVAFAMRMAGVHDPKLLEAGSQRALHKVGLHHRRLARPRQISGGEQQRVAIARALVNDPVFLLADEPTGNLDPAAGAEIITLLREINLGGTGVVIATHDQSIASPGSDRLLQVTTGRLHELPRRVEPAPRVDAGAGRSATGVARSQRRQATN